MVRNLNLKKKKFNLGKQKYYISDTHEIYINYDKNSTIVYT